MNLLTSKFIVPAVLTGLGLYLVGTLLMIFRKAKRSMSWPQAVGTVTDSKVTSGYSGTGKSRGLIYEANVDYTFNVDGQPYYGDTISWSEVSTSSPGHAERRLAAFQVGTEITVYYNPTDPNDCVLDRHVPKLLLALVLLGGIACLIVGLLGMVGVLTF